MSDGPEVNWPTTLRSLAKKYGTGDVAVTCAAAAIAFEQLTETRETADRMVTREELGKVVREAWVAWASEQPDPPPHWLAPWEELDEPLREVDRRIGEALLKRAACAPLTEATLAAWLEGACARSREPGFDPKGEAAQLARVFVSRRTSVVRELPAHPTRDEMFMEFARAAARRSKCGRLVRVGAVVTTLDGTSVVSMGYNGAPRGIAEDCDPDAPGACGCVHAEANALVKAPYGQPLRMYVTISPCVACARLVINSSVQELVYAEEYRDAAGLELLRLSHVVSWRLP